MKTIAKQLARTDMEMVARVHRVSFDERLLWLPGLHTPAEDRAFFRDIVFDRC